MCNTTELQSKTFLDEMRESRCGSNVAFIEFTDNHEYFEDHVFCFYEGEDGKYYNQKNKDVVGENIITIKVGNKKEVLKTWRKIKSDCNYNSVKKCFFIDRDMDDIPCDKDNDLYITPCYSIENLYVSKKTLGNILQSEFSCEKFEKDYIKCMSKFDELLQQFNEQILEFNALVLIRKNKELNNGRVLLNNIKTNAIIDISIEGVTKKRKYDTDISKLKNDLNASDQEIKDAVQKLKEKGDYNSLFRGKNQLDFFVRFLNILIDLHKSKTFFEKEHTSVTISISKNRLSELSQYADIPECLIAFLKNHVIC